jgi:uncharacterized protein YndB with AHSA1/START domain
MSTHPIADYTRARSRTPTARERTFDALTTLERLASWWTRLVSGNPTARGEREFAFSGLNRRS